MKHGKQLRTALLSLLIAGAMTLLMGQGILYRADMAAEDMFYQRDTASDGQIILVGIDQRALAEYGMSRDVLAQTVETLNQSEDCRPAVIGLDVLFTGQTQPGPDGRLARAAEEYGNVVTACAGQFGTAVAEQDGEYYLEDFSLLAFERPYPELEQAAHVGHINAMLDKDGILRRHFLQFQLSDGTEVPSMALAVAERWAEERGTGPLERPETDSRGFWYLPFCGGPGGLINAVSLAEVLSGEVPASYFAGKIVLIGPYAPGLQDSYLTSADHSIPMYGVEVQANAIQAMLWGSYLTEVSDAPQLAALFLLLAAALACFWRRSVKTATAAWAALCGGWVLACELCFRGGRLLHLLWVPVCVSVLYVGCIAFNYTLAALERRRITETFQRYVDKKIIKKLLENGGQPDTEGIDAQIAVLFVDIRGFTTLSEGMDPRQLVRFLNRYLTEISECILQNGGTLDKFVGDEAMAFWGAPLPDQEDYVMDAARAAVDMVTGMERLSQELEAEFGHPIRYGVGIHLGRAVVGNVGCRQRMDYTAIGDTVNTAARLQGVAPGGKVYISRTVADALEGRILTAPVGMVSLKGKEDQIEVLTLEKIL